MNSTPQLVGGTDGNSNGNSNSDGNPNVQVRAPFTAVAVTTPPSTSTSTSASGGSHQQPKPQLQVPSQPLPLPKQPLQSAASGGGAASGVAVVLGDPHQKPLLVGWVRGSGRVRGGECLRVSAWVECRVTYKCLGALFGASGVSAAASTRLR